MLGDPFVMMGQSPGEKVVQEDMAMYKKILIALEGEPTDEAAINHAMILAREVYAKVVLLWVVTIAAEGPSGLGRQFQIEEGSSGWHRRMKGEKTLANLQRRLQLSGLYVETALIIGDRSIADEIVAFAEKEKFDLIIMAADGRPWWRRALFGCPADGVQHKASMPTMFVSDGTRRQKVVTRQKVKFNPTMAILGSPQL
jgi:nucleotide-binding universal stress UspA family protein